MDLKNIQSFKVLKNLQFIEFPKFGLTEMKKIIKTISRLNGCLLMIDYGYLKPNNQNTLQSIMKHKKNNLLETSYYCPFENLQNSILLLLLVC